LRRFLVACLLVVFASLATIDTVACPDGCQSASSSSAADRCNDTGGCLFCSGGVVVVSAHIVMAPLTAVLPASLHTTPAPPLRSAAVPDRPPRPA